MKKLVACVLFLAAVFALCLFNTHAISQRTDKMVNILHQCESAAIEEDYQTAGKLLSQTQTLWERDNIYFCSVLRHSETDEVYTEFRTAFAALDAGDLEDFVCHVSQIRSFLELIKETELFTVANIL